MPELQISVGRRTFELVCGEGQEAHLNGLADQLSDRIDSLAQSMGSNNDTLLLVMAALMLQDELNASRNGEPQNISPIDQGSDRIDQAEHERQVNLAVADAVNAIADYVENVAERVQKG